MRIDLATYKQDVLTSNAVLGWVAMLSMQDTLTPRNALVRALNDHGFDGSQVPNGMNAVEAFRYATRKPTAGGLTVYDLATDQTQEWTLLVREVKKEGFLSRYIIAERKDSTLEYGALAEIRLDRETGQVDTWTNQNPVHPTPPEVMGLATAALTGLVAEAGNAVGTLNYARTRKVLISTVERELNGFQMHRSVWYVPGRTDSRLQELVDAMHEAGLGGVNLMLLPILDTQLNRNLVIEAFREAATSEYLALIERANSVAADVTSGKKPRGSTALGLMEEYKRQTLANMGHIEDLQADIDTLRSTAAAARVAVERAVLAVQAQ